MDSKRLFISESVGSDYNLDDFDVHQVQNNVTSSVKLLNSLRKIWAPRRRARILFVEKRAGFGGVKVLCLH